MTPRRIKVEPRWLMPPVLKLPGLMAVDVPYTSAYCYSGKHRYSSPHPWYMWRDCPDCAMETHRIEKAVYEGLLRARRIRVQTPARRVYLRPTEWPPRMQKLPLEPDPHFSRMFHSYVTRCTNGHTYSCNEATAMIRPDELAPECIFTPCPHCAQERYVTKKAIIEDYNRQLQKVIDAVQAPARPRKIRVETAR